MLIIHPGRLTTSLFQIRITVYLCHDILHLIKKESHPKYDLMCLAKEKALGALLDCKPYYYKGL